MTEGCTPLEVFAVLELRDRDLAVRCLEFVRTNLPTILPAHLQFRVELIALCHHHPANCYPALGVFGTASWEEVQMAETQINAWVEQRRLAWLIARSEFVAAPTWAGLRAGT